MDSAYERVKAWRLANPEKFRAQQNRYREKHPDVIRAATSRCRAKHLSAYRSADLAKQKIKPWAYSAAAARRRAAKLRGTPAWANLDHIQGVYELCAVFRKIGIDMHVDHVVPLQSDRVCGLHVTENLQLLVGSENASKGNRWWPDTAAEL